MNEFKLMIQKIESSRGLSTLIVFSMIPFQAFVLTRRDTLASISPSDRPGTLVN